ncbi:MAG: homocitrate synthase [Deltaproteobacteria bacterium]|nr:homocitrate synthase [Deltaproteobacteria bacterium]
MPTEARIHIIDTTNRDGVRTSRLCLSPLQKTMINLQLNELGICETEVGLAATHHEANYINGNCKLQKLGVLAPICLRGWINALRSDVEQAVTHTQLTHLYMSIPSHAWFLRSRLGPGWSLERVADEVCAALEQARRAKIQSVTVGMQDSARASDADLMMIARRVRSAGADRYRYCDTWGFENPWSIRARVKMLAEELKMPIELHCHDDLGLAVANAIAGALGALDAGVDAYIQTTVNGVGERAGIADLVSVILALKKSRSLRERELVGDQIDLPKAWKLARYAAYALRWPISPRQVALGCNAAVTAGTHIDGAVSEVQDCEVYNVEELGHTEPDIIETGRWVASGVYEGIKGFRNIYGKLEIEFKDQAEATLVLDLVRMASAQNHQPLTGDELRFIAHHPDVAKEIMTQSC